MPSIHELSSLFEELPELPPPAPRQRRGPGATPSTPQASSQQKVVTAEKRWRSLITWFLAWFVKNKPVVRPWKPNPFQVLKNGKKIIVVAAVDSGMISFYRFGQGVFDEWPMT